ADEAFIHRMISVVEANMANREFGVTTLAGELAMSKSALFKRVKDITDSNPVDFIRRVRLRKAAGLLLNSGLKVNEIAAEVGMSDVKYFREQFKKYYAATPSQYVKMQKTAHNTG
ncbi:MAG TPA: helix-turn-helix transcriptional regulator, partial [Anseongella sp.]|nr:helix-turn-helix transcriptional regulator [Anseongella sp.]